MHPVGKVYLLESKAEKRPEDGSGFKPHLVLDEMHEGAEGKDKEPCLSTASVEVKSGEGEDEKEENGVGKYSAITKTILKEKLPYGLINDVGEKRANKQKSYIYLFKKSKRPYSSTG